MSISLVKTWTVRSDTSPKTYSVVMADGAFTCTCADFQYRHAEVGGSCKHIRHILDGMADAIVEASQDAPMAESF